MGMRIWWVTVGIALTVGCGSEGGEDSSGLDFSEFDSTVEAFVSAQGLSGASAAIVHEDLGLVHVAGYGDYAADRVYAVASSSKILSAGVVMRLSDMGMVDVDMPVGNYVEGMFDAGRSDLTLAQMLSNSSGLVGLLDSPLYLPYSCQYGTTGTLTECAETIYSAPDDGMSVDPDTRFRYGGGQWQLAGGIAEVVSGKSWATLVQETYVDPCGVDSLGYTNQFAKAGLAYPAFFDGDPSLLPETDNPNIEGGAYINVEDYATLLLMHLRGGLCGDKRVLSEDAVERMQADRISVYGGSTPDPSRAGYGFGWWVDRDAPVVVDPGAYGAVAALDLGRGYGVFIALESASDVGVSLFDEVKPALDSAFDAAASTE